jgi:hypothetical protein
MNKTFGSSCTRINLQLQCDSYDAVTDSSPDLNELFQTDLSTYTYPLDSKGLGRELETASIFAITTLLSCLAREASSL